MWQLTNAMRSFRCLATRGFRPWVYRCCLDSPCTRSINRCSIERRCSGAAFEFDKVILTYPVLYKYFYQGQQLNSDDVEYSQAMAATQLLANYFDGYFQQQGMYRQMWPDHKWESYIQDHIAKSPLLRSYVRENERWFSPKFVKMCQAVVAQRS